MDHLVRVLIYSPLFSPSWVWSSMVRIGDCGQHCIIMIWEAVLFYCWCGWVNFLISRTIKEWRISLWPLNLDPHWIISVGKKYTKEPFCCIFISRAVLQLCSLNGKYFWVKSHNISKDLWDLREWSLLIGWSHDLWWFGLYHMIWVKEMTKRCHSIVSF